MAYVLIAAGYEHLISVKYHGWWLRVCVAWLSHVTPLGPSAAHGQVPPPWAQDASRGGALTPGSHRSSLGATSTCTGRQSMKGVFPLICSRHRLHGRHLLILGLTISCAMQNRST